MGIHILTHNPMNIALSSIIWKHIADEQCTVKDLTNVDETFVKLMKTIRRFKYILCILYIF
jgi:hypothetical protein